MNSFKTGLRLLRQARLRPLTSCTYATTSYSTPAPNASRITETDVNTARKYCSNLLLNFDSPSYTLQTFLPSSSLDAYLSIRALNIELARIPDLVSNPTVGALRMQFWRDNLTRTFAGTPPFEPVAILLHHALQNLQSRTPTPNLATMKSWFMKLVNAREKYMDNRPFTSLDDLENYAENTYSTLMYLVLANLPMHSVTLDHLSSHIGKATGIVTILRGLPLVAFPRPPNNHSNNAQFIGQMGGQTQGAVMLPLDVMAETGVKEEEIFRKGPEAQGLKDAVFKLATRANDHLITVDSMIRSVENGEDVDHGFEHEGEEGHIYDDVKSPEAQGKGNHQLQEIHRGFGALMPAVSTKLWLQKLEKYDFDVFRPELRVREWKLPWKAYWAFKRKTL